jgi:hypothetical protein
MVNPQFGIRQLSIVILLGWYLSALEVSAFVVPSSSRNSIQGTTTTSLDATALIVQNKGGGHGELGTYVVS